MENKESTRMKTTSLPVNFVLLFSALFFVAVFAEGVLRAVWVPSTHSWNRTFTEYDPVYGWRKIPNAKGINVIDGYAVPESFNSKGIRGPEYSYQKEEDEYRILVLGDSHAEGYSVDFEALFSEVIERKLNEKTIPYYVEVINTGTRGYSTDQELLFFQNEGIRYQADLVILVFCDNDVWYNNNAKMWRWHKPLFKREGGQLGLTNVPVPMPEVFSGQKIKQFFKENSYVYNFVHDQVSRSRFYSWLVGVGLTSYPDDFKMWGKDMDEQVYEAWSLTEAILIQLKEEAVSSGSQLLLFYVPPAASYDADVWRATKRKFRLSDEVLDVGRTAAELESICRRNGIDFLNPTEHFKIVGRILRMQNKRLNFTRDGYWTVEGHQLAGEVLGRYIAVNYLGDPSRSF